MITIFRTGEFDYKDAGINKPVKFDVDNLIEIASRTSEINVTKEHSSEVIDVMSNFIVEDGLLKAKEPNNLELEGMGFSPVLDFDLIDMGDYYSPKNLKMTEIGYTKTPRTKIVYNSVSNGERSMEDKQLRQALDENKKLQEEIGVLKSQNKQLTKRLKDKEKEFDKIKESYADTDAKLKEYDSLKEIETSYNKLISSKRDDLIYKIAGGDKKLADKFKDYTIEQLETTLDVMSGEKRGKGISPKTNPVDDGNNPSGDENKEEEYTDEQFEKEFAESGL